VELVRPVIRRLQAGELDALPSAVQCPGYDHTALRSGIVHLGIGAFMRAHLAVANEAALHATGDLRWGITGVSMRHADTRDALAPQQGLYTVAVRDAGPDGQVRQRLQVIGCVREVRVLPEDPQAVLDRIAHPDARIVSLTVTEKAYVREPAPPPVAATALPPQGAGAASVPAPPPLPPAAEAAALEPPEQQDADAPWQPPPAPELPRSAVGSLVLGLALRRERRLGGLTVMSMDNLPSNGRRLRALVLLAASQRDEALAQWIEQECSFPNSMVDRVVPRTTDADRAAVAAVLGVQDAWPVVAEPFFDWAVEDRFVAGRPDWNTGGARFVAEAAPWEQLKLRMVNGAHSAIAYLGAMAGWDTVHQAFAQPALARHVQALMRDEIEPTLPPLPGLRPEDYRRDLMQRWTNPGLAHRTQQIAMDGSHKIPQRWVSPLRERLEAGVPVARMALGVAAWIHYLRGQDEAGRGYPIDDPMAAGLARLLQQGDEALLACEPVFGELAGDPRLKAAVSGPLRSLRERGVLATLEAMG
jgi:fructuronate reductase